MTYTEDFKREVAADAATLGVRVAADKHELAVSVVSRWTAEFGQAQKALATQALRQEHLNVRRDELLENLFAATEVAVQLGREALEKARKASKARDVLDFTRAAAIALDKAGAVAAKTTAADWTPPTIEAHAELVDPYQLPMPATEKEA